jgi:hypothetical protein
MSEARSEMAGQRERSPSFPFIPLKAAVEQLVAYEQHHKRVPVAPDRIGPAWEMKPNSSQAQQTLAALKAFGFLETRRGSDGRQIVISEDGRIYLRAQQESLKQKVLQRAALRPKQIEAYWREWGADRPRDAACLDMLLLKGGFSKDGAEKFLRVYDETIAYAGLADSDKVEEDEEEELSEPAEGNHEDDDLSASSSARSTNPPAEGKVRLMEGERELTTGLLSKVTSFRVIVNGPVGVREIERLIKKLEFDKEILADESEDTDEANG